MSKALIVLRPIGQQSAAQLPWLHMATRLTDLSDVNLHDSYALSGIDKLIDVAEYQLVRALPEPLDTNLPSIGDIQSEFLGGLGLEDPE